ncbi:hypothetical protein [Caulobacter segnis]|uniref:hypothetical protein n=1 Tax=Caulobacter segnis TaxID=88688 RepID=UPI00285DC3FA|nr:hypothetical protein [Caulobacter segnis]MDR6625984.1 hypothetical protein [Caulobacter segnis]
MATADDHWPETLNRVAAILDFELTNEKLGANTTRPSFRMRAVAPSDLSALPVMVETAVRAGLEIDRLISLPGPGAFDVQARKVRQALVEALNKEPPGAARSPFVTGYKTAYRVELARVIWKAIADAPVRRLEDLARARLV